MKVKTLRVRTESRTGMQDVTGQVQDVVESAGIQDGFVLLHVPHTTAAVTINENADPAVPRDIIHELDKVIPFDDNYHHGEGNSAAHIKSSLFGADQTVMLEGGRMVLGTWQAIFFCEFDGPRSRKLMVKVCEG